MITLKTLPQATAQEVFDQGARHLLTQNEQCSIRDNCRYRMKTPDGRVLKCVGGCFIGDDEYTSKFEDNTWTFLSGLGEVPDAHCDLIRDLQVVHDNCDTSKWPDLLRRRARFYGLSPAVLDEFKSPA